MGPKFGAQEGNKLGSQLGPMSITKLSSNWACQMGPIHCPKFLLPGTVLARILYAASAWRGFATAQDCSRIDRFINRTVNLGYLPANCQTFNSLVNTAEDRLL